MTSNILIDKLKEYGCFSSETESKIKSKIKCISKRKGGLVVKEGQIIKSFFIVEKGLIRSYYNRDGQEVTIWFGYEGIPFLPIASFYKDKASNETIECLEDSVFQYISHNDLNELYKKYPEINTIGRKITEEYCVLLDERIFSFQTKSAEERYHALIKDEPEIIKRVPLGHIASYLGITQETLSRIRRRR